jgi:hypothetical protein
MTNMPCMWDKSTQPPTHPELDGTSLSAPQVTGAALLVMNADPTTFYGWPEMTKAVILASSARDLLVNSNYSSFRNLGPYEMDRQTGLGILDVADAVYLATPQNCVPPRSLPTPRGRYAKTVHLTDNTDFYSLPSTITHCIGT